MVKLDSSIFDESGNLKRLTKRITIGESEESSSYSHNKPLKRFENNLAFKCTYNDNEYCGVCSQKIYEQNRSNGRRWCTDPENDCRDFVGKILTENEYPCYESTLFLNWEFAGGIVRSGKRYGKSLPIRCAKSGKLALLTTRYPFSEEADRFVFGFLYIKEIKKDINDPTASGSSAWFVMGDPDKSLKINPKITLKFWDFYNNPRNPKLIKWGSGLFRYLDDAQILAFLQRLREQYLILNDDERALSVINSHIQTYKQNTL